MLTTQNSPVSSLAAPSLYSLAVISPCISTALSIHFYLSALELYMLSLCSHLRLMTAYNYTANFKDSF